MIYSEAYLAHYGVPGMRWKNTKYGVAYDDPRYVQLARADKEDLENQQRAHRSRKNTATSSPSFGVNVNVKETAQRYRGYSRRDQDESLRDQRHRNQSLHRTREDVTNTERRNGGSAGSAISGGFHRVSSGAYSTYRRSQTANNNMNVLTGNINGALSGQRRSNASDMINNTRNSFGRRGNSVETRDQLMNTRESFRRTEDVIDN